MKTPRTTPLLAALAILASSALWAGAAPKKKDSPEPRLPTGWQAHEEPSSNWLNVYIKDPKTRKTAALRCRRSDCFSSQKEGMAPLYRLIETHKDTILVDTKVPKSKTVLGRTFYWTSTEKRPMDKVSFTSEVSNYSYDRATKEVTQGSFRQKVDIFDTLAKHDAPSFEAMPSIMIVSAPTKVADDRVAAQQPAKKPTTQPRKKPTPPAGKKPSATAPSTKPDIPPAAEPERKPDISSTTLPTTTEPDKKPDAAQDLKPLTDEERQNLTETERLAYEGRLKQVRAKLEEAKKKKDPAGIAAANEEMAAIIAEYRKKAADNAMSSIPKTVDELNALTKAQQQKFCADLARAPQGSFVGGYTIVSEAKDQLAASAEGTDKAKGIMTGDAPRSDAAVTAAPPPQVQQTEVDKMRARCKELMAALPSGGSVGNIAGKVPDIKDSKGPEDCEKGKDGKCIVAEKADPNKWLNVKMGVAGLVPGLMVGSFFGPVGLIVCAAIGFGVFWGLGKLNN